MKLPAQQSLLTLLDAAIGSQLSQLEHYQKVIILELRLPRLLLSILIGAMLSQCGAVMQGLFRNPLADPGIIGVSSGAAIGAIVAIIWLADIFGPLAIPVCAFIMGLLTTLLVYSLAQSKSGTSVIVLLLAGVAVSAFAGAAIGFLSYFSNDQKLRELSLWQMGSLTGASEANIGLVLIVLCILWIFFQKKANALNALILGESEARHLGINVERLKLQLMFLTAIGVGVAVAFSGVIGFVGLIVPHLIRITTGPKYQTLLPLSALCGAALLAIADLLSRIIVQPAELPVGLITALLGAPFFIALLLKQKKQWNG